MSGHSKWHNIQKTKGAADAKRSAAFTKIAKEIIVAVKQGGSGDPNNNSRLATVIAKAKAANMPNDNIKRTIDEAPAETCSRISASGGACQSFSPLILPIIRTKSAAVSINVPSRSNKTAFTN